MTATLDIWNSALTKVGSDELTDPQEATTAGGLCRTRWPRVRDAVLRAHPWNFAKRRQTIATTATTPDFGWAYAYDLPVDPFCLRPLRIEPHGDDFVVEGRQILTDVEAPLYLRYIARIDDPSLYDAMFFEVSATLLASELAPRLANSAVKARDLLTIYRQQLQQARAINAKETQYEPEPPSDWLGARL